MIVSKPYASLSLKRLLFVCDQKGTYVFYRHVDHYAVLDCSVPHYPESVLVVIDLVKMAPHYFHYCICVNFEVILIVMVVVVVVVTMIVPRLQ